MSGKRVDDADREMWKCDKCGNNNYIERAECNTTWCKAPKPSGGYAFASQLPPSYYPPPGFPRPYGGLDVRKRYAVHEFNSGDGPKPKRMKKSFVDGPIPHGSHSPATGEDWPVESTATLTLESILPNICVQAASMSPSKFLQKRLEEGGESEWETIFEAALPHALELAVNEHGSFVVQKLLERASPEHAGLLFEYLAGNVVRLSLDEFGTRVIQKLLEFAGDDHWEALADEFRGHMLECITDKHANHMVQKCIKLMPADCLGFLVEELAGKAVAMSNHAFGCRAIQCLVRRSCCVETIEVVAPLLDELVPGCASMASDKSGNFVVQCMLQHGRSEDASEIIAVAAANVLDFATDRFASNILEKCFWAADEGPHARDLEDARDGLLQAIIEGEEEEPPVHVMINNQFGNFVVRAALKHVRGEAAQPLQEALELAKHTLKNSGKYGEDPESGSGVLESKGKAGGKRKVVRRVRRNDLAKKEAKQLIKLEKALEEAATRSKTG